MAGRRLLPSSACELGLFRWRPILTLTRSAPFSRVAAAPYFSKYGDRAPSTTKFSSLELAKRSFSHFSLAHIKGLFATPRLVFSSGLIIFIYAALGLAYPLFNGFLSGYLQSKVSGPSRPSRGRLQLTLICQGAERGDTSVNATYSSYTYQAACGIIGSILATFLVEWGRGGRKFAGAFFTVGAGVRFPSSLLRRSVSDDYTHTGFPVWTNGSPICRRRQCLDLHGLALRKRFVSLSLISGRRPDVPLTSMQQLWHTLRCSTRDGPSISSFSSSKTKS